MIFTLSVIIYLSKTCVNKLINGNNEQGFRKLKMNECILFSIRNFDINIMDYKYFHFKKSDISCRIIRVKFKPANFVKINLKLKPSNN